MAQNKKLELTWVGKDEAKQPVEPRILIEDPSLSYGTTSHDVLPNGKDWNGNMVIHGDNLLALQALLPHYANSVKCIYIDPPYNTGNAFEHYDDSLEHSIWLGLMRDRLILLRDLLADELRGVNRVGKEEETFFPFEYGVCYGIRTCIFKRCSLFSSFYLWRNHGRQKVSVQQCWKRISCSYISCRLCPFFYA